jgi:hypothetical protein
MVDGGFRKKDAGSFVVRECLQLGLPVVVVSGYAEPPGFSAEHPGVPWVVYGSSVGIKDGLSDFLDAQAP